MYLKFVWLRLFVCLFVCLFAQFFSLCQSVPKHKHRHVFLCHLNPVINNLMVGEVIEEFKGGRKCKKFKNSNPAEGWENVIF